LVSFRFGWGMIVGSWKYINAPSGTIKDSKFPDYLIIY
jgi:hypothetical protein